MKIKYFGGSSFLFKGKKVSVAVDPKAGMKADIILLSSAADGSEDVDSKVFTWPGEYEVAGVPIVGVQVEGKERVFYRFTVDDVSIAVLTGVHEKLGDKIIDKLGDVHVLLMPIRGGEMELDAKKAHNVFEELEPYIVIPFDYEQKQLNDFAKEFGAMPEPVEEYELTKAALPVDRSECVVLAES